MDSLVHCPCGHGIERHGASGCMGTARERCDCRLAGAEALDAAVDHVRSAGPTGPFVSWNLAQQAGDAPGAENEG